MKTQQKIKKLQKIQKNSPKSVAYLITRQKKTKCGLIDTTKEEHIRN